MKKVIKKFFSVLIMLVLLLSSGCKKDNHTPENEGKTIELNITELENKINAKESFVVILKSIEDEPSIEYLEIVEAYTENTNTDIYYLDVNDGSITEEILNQLETTLKNMPSYESDCLSIPSTVLVMNGVIKNAINGNIEYSKLEEFVSSYIKLTMANLQSKIEANKTFLFVVKSRYCSHCIAYEPVLKSYVQNKEKTIYYLDVADNADISLNNEKLQELKNKIENVNRDYDKLYTPVTVKVENGEIIDAIIGNINLELLENFIN